MLSHQLTLLSSLCLLAAAAPSTALPRTSSDEHPFLKNLPWDIHQSPTDRLDAYFAKNPHSEQAEHYRSRRSKRDFDIPTDGLPPYPVAGWITTNASSWAILANAGVRRMQTWYTSGSPTYESTSWWQQPVILASYMDLDTALGDSANENVIKQMLSNNERGVQYIIDAYVDDQAWWGLITARAYQLYGDSDYLSAAKTIQSSDTSYWTSDCGGGLLWLTYKPSEGKNTVTNTLHIAVDARLYLITGDETYLDDATRTLDWWTSWAYDSSTGKVWDTLTAYDCEKQYEQLFTYNSGIIVGALVDLYKGTGNTSYLTTAQNIAFAAIRDFSTSDGIMQEGCEHDGPPNGDNAVSAADGGPLNNLPAGCQSDTIMFKAILAQNLGYLYRASPDVRIYNYLTYNFLFNACFNMDDTFLFSEWWGGPFNSTLANQLTQGNALGLLSAGVAVQLWERNISGLPAPTITNSFEVPLPTYRRNRVRTMLGL